MPEPTGAIKDGHSLNQKKSTFVQNDAFRKLPLRDGMNETASVAVRPDVRVLTPRHLLYLQRAVGNQAVLHLLQRAASDIGSGGDPKRRELAEQVKTEIKTFGGLNVAVYLQNIHHKKNDAEFRGQADQYAADHGAYGLSGGKLKRGVAMVIDDDVSDLMESVTDAANALLDEFPELFDENHPKPDVKIQTLSVFTHGARKQLKAGATGKRWISPDKFVKHMAPLLTASPIINLYACQVAGPVAAGKQNFAGAVQESLTEALNEIYGESFVEVWGHTSTAHTTFNPDLGMAGPTGGVNMQRELGRRLAEMVIEELGAQVDETQRATLQVMAAKMMRSTFSPVERSSEIPAPAPGEKKRKRKWFTGWKNPKNVYFREINLMGLERVWEDLTARSDPTDYSDLGLSEEAQDRMVEGIHFFRIRFQNSLTTFREKAAELIGVTPDEPKPSGSLTDEEVHGAIQYNRYRGYDAGQVEDIQNQVGTTPTGVFEEPTVLAVAHWQDRQDLTDDGKVGPMTHKEMFGSANQPDKDQPNHHEDKPEENTWWSSLWDTVTDWFS